MMAAGPAVNEKDGEVESQKTEGSNTCIASMQGVITSDV